MSHVETPWVVGSRPVRNPVPDLNALKKVVPQALTRFARGHVHWLADPQGRLFLFKMLPRGSVGAEIGVWKGDFSKLLFIILATGRRYIQESVISHRKSVDAVSRFCGIVY